MFEKYPPEIREKLRRIYDEWVQTSNEKTGAEFVKYAVNRLGTKYYKELLEVAEEIDKRRKKPSFIVAAFAFILALIIGLSKVMRGEDI